MTRNLSSIGLILLIALAGCNQSAQLDRIAPQEVASAKTYFDLLKHGKYDQIENVLDPSIRNANMPKLLTSMGALIPAGDPLSIKTVGAHVFCTAHKCDTDITLEYEFPTDWLLVSVSSRKEDGDITVTGFRLRRVSESLEETNRFGFRGKSVFQYIFLLLAVIIPAFSLYVLVLCIRTKNLRRKWLWIVFILIGIGRVGMIWTTGKVGFSLFYIQLFSSSITAQFYGPWVISISLPLGAILFWNSRTGTDDLAHPAESTPLNPNAPPADDVDLPKLDAEQPQSPADGMNAQQP